MDEGGDEGHEGEDEGEAAAGEAYYVDQGLEIEAKGFGEDGPEGGGFGGNSQVN